VTHAARVFVFHTLAEMSSWPWP